MELGDILDCAYELVGEENRLKDPRSFYGWDDDLLLVYSMIYRLFLITEGGCKHRL